MRVTVTMPSSMWRTVAADGEKALAASGGTEVEGRTVDECLTALVCRYPELRASLLSEDAKLLLKWMVYVNDELLASSASLSRPVENGDTIGLFPVASGG